MPMDDTLKTIARVIIIVAVVIYAVMILLGMAGHLPAFR